MTAHRTTTVLLLAASALLSTGCGGPTKAGTEARTAARQRMEKASSVIVYDQARQSFESGQLDRALKQIDEAILRSPEEPRSWILRGRILLEAGRLEPALASFEKASTLRPESAEAQYYQGIVHERWFEPEKALVAYAKATELDEAKVAYLLAWAETMVALRRYEEVKATLGSKLTRFENSAPLHQLLGQVAMLTDDPEDAVRHFNRARLIDPSIPMILENLVRARFAAGQWQACLEDVRRLQREGEGGRTVARMRLEGRCLVMLGRHDDARAIFAQITRESPEDTQAWIDLAAASWELGELARVQSAAQRLLRLAPQRYEGYVFLGLVEEARGDAASAERLFQRATALADGRGEVAGLIGQLSAHAPVGRVSAEPSVRLE
jgi:tetratricopeptide (TPR) repeat protein